MPAEKPLSPDVLANALQDRAHADLSGSRPAVSVRMPTVKPPPDPTVDALRHVDEWCAARVPDWSHDGTLTEALRQFRVIIGGALYRAERGEPVRQHGEFQAPPDPRDERIAALEKQLAETTKERETARDLVAEALRENRRLDTALTYWKRARESELLAGIESVRLGFMPKPGEIAPLDSVPAGATDFLALMFIANLRATGAANYVEHRFVTREEDNDIGQIIVTVQKVSGKTPNEMQREAETQRDALAAGLRDAIEAIGDMTGFTEAAHYAEKYGIAETVARLRLLLPPEDSVATVKEPGP